MRITIGRGSKAVRADIPHPSTLSPQKLEEAKEDLKAILLRPATYQGRVIR